MNKGQKFGNAIHFKSKEWYIRGDIFFKEGDQSPELINFLHDLIK